MQKYLLFILVFFLITSCSKKDEDIVLTKSSFSDLVDFEKDSASDAYKAFRKSCEAISEKKEEYLGENAIKINRKDFMDVCAKSSGINPYKFKEFVKNNFTPYLVSYKGASYGKFTAYYEAEINASYTKDEKYKYPIHGVPYDLVEVNLNDFDENLPNKRILGRVDNGKLVPYYTRKEIYEKGINAPVILWGDSYVDIYVMQIQGSAIANLPNGEKIRISFAESNGRKFKGIGSILLSKKLIPSGQASMGNIKKWLKENFDTAKGEMNENQRYIFHKISDNEGPIGALGVDLTAGRSLAVDKAIIPLGALLWLETTGPDNAKLNRLVLAQDIGSAIKGAVRGDFFWGSGGDDVLEKAGKMNSKGQYYILIPNTAEITNGKKNSQQTNPFTCF